MEMTSSSSISSIGQIVYNIRSEDSNNGNDTIQKTTVQESDLNDADEEEESTDFSTPEAILCVLWQGGTLGASYYKPKASHLYVFRDSPDAQPAFLVLKSLYREINPKHTITLGQMSSQFKEALFECATFEEDENNIHKNKYIPQNVSLLPGKDYSKTACEHEIYKLSLASQPTCYNEEDKILYLQSLIDFESELSVYALGILLKYIDKNLANFALDSCIRFLHISQACINDMVLMDNNTFNALKIFQCIKHNSSFKHGGNREYREGLSIFKMYSSHCSSTVGVEYLRSLLMHPSKNLSELLERHEFIELILKPENSPFLNNLRENIKRISNVDSTLHRIVNSKSNHCNWERLQRTIYHILLIHQLCRPYCRKSTLLENFNISITDELYTLFDTIKLSIDFEKTHNNKKLTIKLGTDAEYDSKILKREDILKQLATAATIVEKQIPTEIASVCVSYLPDIGYLVVMSEPPGEYDPAQQFHHLGYRYLFMAYKKLYYKTPLCLELDRLYGDIHGEILFHENRVMFRLMNYVKESIKNIQEPIRVIGKIDSLISLALVAREFGHVKPKLDLEKIIEIEKATHPLMEICLDSYVRNSFYSGGTYSHVKILTGPNASGKSVYLKQVALIVYLAHVGCYISAKLCRIGLVFSMHTRIQTTEAASVPLSAFMLDLQQMSHAMYTAKASSLILIDEFGRGTIGSDGTILLAASLKKFITKGEFCCHILTSTHLHMLTQLIPVSPLVSHIKMDYTITTKRELVFIYTVVEGVANSFAFDAALCGELDNDLIDQGREALSAHENHILPKPIVNAKKSYNADVVLLNLNLPEIKNCQSTDNEKSSLAPTSSS